MIRQEPLIGSNMAKARVACRTALVIRGSRRQSFCEAVWTKPPLRVFLLCFLTENKEPVTQVVQAIYKPGTWPAGMHAFADLDETLVDFHCHALIEYEAFA